MKLETLRDLFIHELKDLYSAEKQLIKALPKIAKAVTTPELKEGILQHLEETKEHASRLETVLSGLGSSTRGPKCKAMEGLLEEGSSLIEEEGDGEVLDAGIICGSQKIEHYEIAGYGTVCAWAELLGETEALETLKQTLSEEKATDEKLSQLALTVVNVAAEDGDEEEEDDEDDETPKRGSGSSSPKKTVPAKKAAAKKTSTSR